MLIGEAADLVQRHALWFALPVGLYGSNERLFFRGDRSATIILAGRVDAGQEGP